MYISRLCVHFPTFSLLTMWFTHDLYKSVMLALFALTIDMQTIQIYRAQHHLKRKILCRYLHTDIQRDQFDSFIFNRHQWSTITRAQPKHFKLVENIINTNELCKMCAISFHKIYIYFAFVYVIFYAYRCALKIHAGNNYRRSRLLLLLYNRASVVPYALIIINDRMIEAMWCVVVCSS